MTNTAPETASADAFERDAAADRIIAFTDAAVAIALTLLVLPLMEAVATVTEEGGDVHLGEWLVEHRASIFTFVLSFAIVALYWFMHHRAVERVRSFTGGMLPANFFWLFSIVLLPVTSAMSVAFKLDAVQVSVYIGTLVLINGALLWLQLEIARNPKSGASWREMRKSIGAAIASLILVLIAWPIIALTPLEYLGMGVMAFVPLLTNVITRFLPRGN